MIRILKPKYDNYELFYQIQAKKARIEKSMRILPFDIYRLLFFCENVEYYHLKSKKKLKRNTRLKTKVNKRKF